MVAATKSKKPTKGSRDRVQFNVRNLSPQIRNKLKTECAKRGVTMEAAVISLIEDFICGHIRLSIGPTS